MRMHGCHSAPGKLSRLEKTAILWIMIFLQSFQVAVPDGVIDNRASPDAKLRRLFAFSCPGSDRDPRSHLCAAFCAPRIGNSMATCADNQGYAP